MPHRKNREMEVFGFTTLVTLLLLLSFTANAETNFSEAQRPDTSNTYNNSTEFITNSCGVTRYPNICTESLASYSYKIKTSYSKLAYMALTISLKSAKSASLTVSKLIRYGYLKPNEASALKDCVENMSDSIDEVRQSLGELKNFTGSATDLEFKMSNVQTWLSAALSDDDTCTEGLDEEAVEDRVKNTIRSRVVTVAQLTSNALALVNHMNFSSMHSP